LAIIARLHGKVAQPEHLVHQLGLTAAARPEDLLLAARQIGLKASLASIDLERAAQGRAPLPCVVELASGEFAVLARAEGQKALLHDPAEGRATVVSFEDLKPRLSGRAVLIASRARLRPSSPASTSPGSSPR
jgi:subfamily B ATP-binding cassette protein HlyB/CyaB